MSTRNKITIDILGLLSDTGPIECHDSAGIPETCRNASDIVADFFILVESSLNQIRIELLAENSE